MEAAGELKRGDVLGWNLQGQQPQPQGMQFRASGRAADSRVHDTGEPIAELSGRCIPTATRIRSAMRHRLSIFRGATISNAFGASDTSGGYLVAAVVEPASHRPGPFRIRDNAGRCDHDSDGPSAELMIARVTGDPTSYWRSELVTVTSGDITLDKVTLRPRTLAVLVPISLEWAEDSQNGPALIEQVMHGGTGPETRSGMSDGFWFGCGAAGNHEYVRHRFADIGGNSRRLQRPDNGRAEHPDCQLSR